jgi:integrase
LRVRRAHPTDYFNRREFKRIAEATNEYEYGGGADCWHRARRMRALVLLMRWSGLAIKDAVMLERKGLDAHGALFLRRAKTGVPVFVPLPPVVVASLRTLPSANPVYFFWSGNGDPRSAVQGYKRSFRKLFRIADIRNADGTPKPCRPHMFRDTFAVELLLAGVPIDQVSTLLGHRSIKVTEKHYLPWVKARQDQLTASIRQAWFSEVRQAPPEGAGGDLAGTEDGFRLSAARCHSIEVHGHSNPRGARPFFLYL